MTSVKSIAYPNCQSTGGKYTHLPEFYQEWDIHMKETKRRSEEESRKKQAAQWDKFFENFDPFGNYGERTMPCSYEEIDSDEEDGYPYSIFSLKRTASQEEMKTAYRKALLENHPDKTHEDTSDAFRIIQEAYEYYCDYVL
tara:strand:+ start:5 stop:427 length:423 start_codon:yes stop_codon:yes gene_type:complete